MIAHIALLNVVGIEGKKVKALQGRPLWWYLHLAVARLRLERLGCQDPKLATDN